MLPMPARRDGGTYPVKLAVLDDYLGVLRGLVDWSVLPTSVQVDIFQDHLADEDALVARLRDHNAVIGMRERTPFPAKLLDRLPNLKLLVTLGTANPSFDIAHATKLGIVVCGTGASGVDPIELTWALILAATKNIAREDRAVREGRWQTALGTRLAGNTLGVLGLGRIGAAVAEIGRAFGMEVIAWSQNLTAERARACGAELVSKEELLRRADVVTVHLRLGARTQGLVGGRELALMKPTAYLINTARSRIVDEAALVEALRERKIAGAALDVFDEEPLPRGHPLLFLDNVVIAPHLGGVTAERYRADYTEAVADVAAYLEGRPVRVLNPDVLAAANLRRMA